MLDDLAGRYQAYLERWMSEAGDVPVGSFVKFAGKLIKKLSFEEFTPVFIEHKGMAARYVESVERGDTVNDVVVKVLRDQAAQLMMQAPV